jgi:hypothetical protein
MIVSKLITQDFLLLLIYSVEVLILKESTWSSIMVLDFVKLDFPTDRDTYLHRVGRAGRFGTKGLAINFVKPDDDSNEG